MFTQNAASMDFAASANGTGLREVDEYGIPLALFGSPTPPEFFAVVGRIVAINGRIEYMRDRLQHLPPSEIVVMTKVQQFLHRYNSGRAERNAIVHSSWVFGADSDDPDVIWGVRYKVGKSTTEDAATVSIRDVPNSERTQETVGYTMVRLRKILKRDLITMQVGEIAYAVVMRNWAMRRKPDEGAT
jgi:hypothetical protein